MFSLLFRQISDEVRVKIKNNQWPERYKCVVYVTFGMKNQQGVQVSSECAWNEKTDNYFSCCYENESLFCAVAVFAIYCE